MWVNLVNILSGRSQAQKATCCVKCPEERNPYKQKVDLWLPGTEQ